MKNFPQFKICLTWLGRGLMLLSLFFVMYKLWNYKGDITESISEPWLWLFIMMFCILYGLAGILLSYGWLSLLRAQGLKSFSLSWTEAWSLYGKTQIAKYVPGNIFHIAGRHALANQKGVSHSQLVVAATLEILLVLISAGIISLLSFSQIIREMHNVLSIFTVFILAGVALVLIASLIGHSKGNVKIPKKLQWRKIMIALVSYLVFFMFSCSLFLFTIMIVITETPGVLLNWPLIIGGYAFAWAVGFVVPGAPAGLGIREATLLTLLSSIFSSADLLLGILVFRMINTLGDMVFFIVSVVVQNYSTGERQTYQLGQG